MTMTKAHMLCILWMIIFFSSSSTVRAAQRDTVPKQQQTTSTKDSSTPGQLLPISSSSGYRNSTSTSAVSSSTSISISTPSSSSSSSASGSTPGSGRFLPAETTAPPTEQARVGPYFDVAASKNVTALLGKTAYLNCRVKNLGNKTMLLQVSWVRHRDIHLLTVGRYTYTSDQRFRAIHHPHTEDWSLQIKYPQHRDSGIYECQISTTPHMSHFVHLNVIEPSTEIIGAPDLYIESGSTINLTCVVKDSPEPPAYIFWNHNNAIISYDSPRGGVSVITEKGDTTTSFLLIQNARPSDSGQYTCNPSNAKSKSVTVHVLNGVSHSVSRGVPSSNAARGTTASSHAAQPSALGAGVGACLVLALLHRYAASAGHFRWPGWPDTAARLVVACFSLRRAALSVASFARTTHTRLSSELTLRFPASPHPRHSLPLPVHRTCPSSTTSSSCSSRSRKHACLHYRWKLPLDWYHHNHRWRTASRSPQTAAHSEQHVCSGQGTCEVTQRLRPTQQGRPCAVR